MTRPNPFPQAVLETLESRRLFAAGDLDPTFGNGGLFQHSIPEDVFLGYMVTLSDGKMLFGGGTLAAPLAVEHRYVLARYNADGTPDTTFGDGGMLFGDLTSDKTDSGLGQMELTPDGKIVAFGTIDGNGTRLLRFNPNGTLDTTFGGDGIVEIPLYTDEALAVQPDGKVLTVTETGRVTRYLADGSVDTDFGDDGTSAALFPNGVQTMQVQPDGKILLGGGPITRLNADGSLDTAFGDEGFASAQAPGAPQDFVALGQIAVLDDGKILVVAAANGPSALDDEGGFAVVRFNSDGTVDQSYNNGGVYVSFGAPVFFARLLLDDDGRAYLIGDQPRGTAMARLNADGTFDETFGRVIADITANNAAYHTRGATIQSNGNLVLAAQENRPLQSGRGYAHSLELYRVLTDDNAPSPIVLDANVLSLAGTGGADLLGVSEFSSVFLASREGFGRLFFADDVQTITVSAGAGDDEVEINTHTLGVNADGGAGNDKIAGGRARDYLLGGSGRDFIDGGLGADLIVGGGGHDKLRGQGGADHVYGRAGNDFVMGNGGNDRIDGGDGLDVLVGGGGNDLFLAADGLIDQLFGSDGDDSASADEDDEIDSVETIT